MVQRYSTTTLVAIISLVGLGGAAAMFLTNSSEASDRFALLIGLITLAVTTLLNTQKSEQASNVSETTKTSQDKGLELSGHLALAQAELLKTTGNALQLRKQLTRSATDAINGNTVTGPPTDVI